jgi:hypothetical protein
VSARVGELVWLDPKRLQPNDWNPNRMNAFMYAKALDSIQTHGFVDPVTAYNAFSQLVIIDGEHRWQVAMDLQLPEIPVFVVESINSESDAKKLTILLNELRGQALPEKMGDLLKDLMGETSLEDLLRELPYTEEMFRGFTELPPLTDLDRPTTSSVLPDRSEPERRWVERLYRLPLAAATVLDQAIAQAKDGEEVEDWQALERMAADFLAG